MWHNVCQAPEETQWQLQVVMWPRQRPTPPPATHGHVAANGGPSTHVYGTLIRTRVRQKLREILLTHTLESYSRLQSFQGQPFIHSPLPLVKAYVLEQPAAFRRQNLPPGLPLNHDSMASLLTFLRSIVKHERTHLRNMLLINVRQEARARELGPVPKLFELVVKIDRQFQPQAAMQKPEEIQAQLHWGVRVQIAMLHIITIHHLAHRAPGDMRSQWDLIDNHLEAVRGKSDLQIAAHAILILRQDRELFPGNVMFLDVPVEMARTEQT
ncbi:hypothetical protein PtA15_2A683 [Puccinia triticina]|uniref:Uncharacterized protein n=1 Tax=Puccinia triticina TaxID=208348 RepID=A0ABY7CAZ7_9BASI|nr:uncharacterized protein PtA15_2A683 [Puccinia triticina]WAQ82366.1 hypothetical protein PtA15_2A683 [Puccinia triticina]